MLGLPAGAQQGIERVRIFKTAFPQWDTLQALPSAPLCTKVRGAASAPLPGSRGRARAWPPHSQDCFFIELPDSDSKGHRWQQSHWVSPISVDEKTEARETAAQSFGHRLPPAHTLIPNHIVHSVWVGPGNVFTEDKTPESPTASLCHAPPPPPLGPVQWGNCPSQRSHPSFPSSCPLWHRPRTHNCFPPPCTAKHTNS